MNAAGRLCLQNPAFCEALQNVAISHRISAKTGIFRGRTESSAPTVQNGKSTRICRKAAINRTFPAGRCRHRPLRRETGNAAIFRLPALFSIPFVGADDSVRPTKSCNFARLIVGADAHIGPLKCCGFALNFRKNGRFRRADIVVRPYGAKSKSNTGSPENRHKIGAFGGSMWASTPTARNGKRSDFCRTRVIFNTLYRGGRLCPPYKIVQFCAVVCRGRCPHRPIKMLRIRIGFP